MDQKDIRQRETEGQETEVLLKRLRVSAVFHALLVLLGAFVTQFVASMLCMIVTGAYVLFVQGRTREDLSKLLMGSLGDYSMIISLVYAVGGDRVVRHPVLPLDLEGAAVFLPEGL